MPANIEIKARVEDPQRVKAIAETLVSTPGEIIEQEDTFFLVPRGRLKLRSFTPDSGELIYYERENQPGPRESRYRIAQTSEPGSVKAVLAMCLGIRGVVRKRRTLYRVGQTRVHLDEVEGLGSFAELEVVLRDNQPASEGVRIARGLMEQLEIRESDLVEQAYIDLLEEAGLD